MLSLRRATLREVVGAGKPDAIAAHLCGDGSEQPEHPAPLESTLCRRSEAVSSHAALS